MLGEVFAWSVAILFVLRFALDYLIHPIIDTVFAVKKANEPPEGDTHAMGFDLSPSDDDDWDDDEEEMKMGFRLK